MPFAIGTLFSRRLTARYSYPDLKSPSFYQASIYAWNAFRENKTITSVKHDTKKGFYAVAG